MDLERAQRGGGVGGEERVAGAGGEDHDAALLEVAHRAAADVGLGDLGDRDRRLHARVHAVLLERVLQRQRVEDGREHAHVVAGRAVHARGGALRGRGRCCRRRRRSRPRRRGRARALIWPGDRPRRARGRCRSRASPIRASPDSLSRTRLKTGSRPSAAHAPTANRAKRRITTFSPVLPESSARSCSIVLPSYLSRVDVLLVEQHDLLEPLVAACPRRSSGGRSRACRRPAARRRAARPAWRPRGSSSSETYCVGRRGGDVQRDVAGERDEVVVAGDEVGVAVDLDEHADLAVGVDVGLRRCPRWPRGRRAWRLVAEPDAQQLDGLVDVAVGLGRAPSCSPSCPRRCGRAAP